MEGRPETMYNQITSYLVWNNMETCYTCTQLSFVNQENEKIRNWSLLTKIISTVTKLLFFKTTDLYTVYLFSEYTDNWNIINLG